MRSFWIKMDPKSKDWCHHKKKKEHSLKEKVHLKTEAEIREMLPQIKGLQRLLATHQKVRQRHRTDSSSESPEEQLC